MKLRRHIRNKCFIFGALTLALGITLEVNTASIKADTTSNTETTTKTTNTAEDESSYFTDIIGGSNETTASDGSVTATLNHDGHTYTVTGQVGQKVLVKSSDGNTAYILINKNTIQNFSDGAEVSLEKENGGNSKYKLYDQYGEASSYGLAGGQTVKVDQKIVTNTGKTYYHVISDQVAGNNDLWLEQTDGVTLKNDKLTGDTKDFMSYGILERYASTTNFKTEDDPTISGDTVSGEMSIPSKNYGTDFEYTYSGKPGETVDAVMKDKNAADYPNAPKVRVKISSVVVNKVSAASIVNLAEPATRTYRLYDGNGAGTSAYYAGGSNYNTDSIMKIGNDTFYKIAFSGWVKQSPGVTLKQDGEATAGTKNNITVYVDEPVVADVSISTNEGAEVVKNQTGEIGDEINVTVPTVSGLTPDESTIKALVNPDGTITSLEKVTYTKKSTSSGSSSGSNSSSSSSSNNSSADTSSELTFNRIKQTVATYPYKNEVRLYSLKNNELNLVKNRALAPATDWMTDEYVTINGMRYYRVATNEWAKADDVYLYETKPMILKVDNLTRLISSEDKLVKNRALAANTSWKVDRVGYLGDYNDPIPAYRVATNEFVPEDK